MKCHSEVKEEKMKTALFITDSMDPNRHYKTSTPTNRYERVRLWLARRLIAWGLKLLLNNGECWVTSHSIRSDGV